MAPIFKFIVSCDLSTFYQGETITYIQFPLNRYGLIEKTLRFHNPVCLRQAIRLVQKYLSQPLTTAFYNTVIPRGGNVVVYPGDCRGKLLGRRKRLDRVEKIDVTGIRLCLVV
jgi:hypothetical protein